MLDQILDKIFISNRCPECPILLFPQNIHSAISEGIVHCAMPDIRENEKWFYRAKN